MKIRIIKTERVLAPTQISLADYVINPYRGCSFGCLYCYSQENKNIRPENFSQYLGVKINAPEILKEELENKQPQRVLIGSTAECFQEVEKRYKITGKILQILNTHNISYTILTKSALIKDYLDTIAINKKNEIYFTFNLASEKMIKILEKKSSSLASRLDAINEIIKKNINFRVHLGPFIPYLTNLEAILSLLPQKVKKINIELYNNKTGNFKQLLKAVEVGFGPKKKEQLAKVYENQKNYYSYINGLKSKTLKLKNKRGICFFLIAPTFNQYYSSSIDYNQQLK